jgi:hypothetical protein
MTACSWVLRCDSPEDDHRHSQPADMHPGLYNHPFVPATSALVEALTRCAIAAHVQHEGHVPFNPATPGFQGCPVESCKRNAAALSGGDR